VLERVLPVLYRRLYDGGDSGVVFRAVLRAEASSDLEFGLGRPERLLAVVVRGRDGRVREEGEDVTPVLGDALFELAQLGLWSGAPEQLQIEVFGISCFPQWDTENQCYCPAELSFTGQSRNKRKTNAI